MIFYFIIIIFWQMNLLADDFPEISGCFCEGGVIIGKLKNPNYFIKINKSKIQIYEDGYFIYAFGRKFANSFEISINGKKKKFGVEKKKYKVELINGLPKSKVEPSQKEINKIKKDQLKIRESKKTGQRKKLFEKKFIIPVKGRISGVYGSQRILNSKPRSPHKGIDIAAPLGTDIVAPSSGVIKLSEDDMFFTGKTVVMDHGLGLISIFAHLEDINVSVGDKINRGEKLGTVGMTGRASGPHLHWGIYLNETSVDPMSVLNFELN